MFRSLLHSTWDLTIYSLGGSNVSLPSHLKTGSHNLSTPLGVGMFRSLLHLTTRSHDLLPRGQECFTPFFIWWQDLIIYSFGGKNVSPPSPSNDEISQSTPLRASVLADTPIPWGPAFSLAHRPVSGFDMIYNSPNPPLADIVYFCPLHIVINLTVLKRVY